MKSVVALLVVAALACSVAAQTSLFTATDMHQLRRLGDYAVSSNNQVVYSVSQWNSTTDKTISRLYTTGFKQVTPPEVTHASSPSFITTDPDTLFYLAPDASGVTNVFAMSLSGRVAPYQVTSYAVDVSNVRVTPNYFVFTVEVYAQCGTDFSCTAAIDAANAANPNRAIEFNSLFVRHWDQLALPNKFSWLYSVQWVKGSNGRYSLPNPQQLNFLQNGATSSLNVPVPPDGGLEQIAISPYYDRVAFTGAIVDHSSAWTTGWKTYEIEVDPKTGTPLPPYARCLTCNFFDGIRTTAPKYDPTGNYLAFLAMERPGFEADRLHLEVFKVGVPGAAPRPVTKFLDRSIVDYAWTTDGYSILLTFDEDGDERLYSIKLDNNKMQPIIVNGSSGSIKVVHEAVYYTLNSYNKPADIQSFMWDSQTNAPLWGSDRAITTLNPELLQRWPSLTPGTKFYFPSPFDGAKVQGWFLPPRSRTPGDSRKYPLALIIHGGPQGGWNSAWSYRWNPQLWAQNDYATILINPHGSTGWGQSFTDIVSGNWGGIPFDDLMAGLDSFLKANPWVDTNRLAACGASYGGFMINWIQGNAPTRFSSLVVHDGLYDVPISYGATDELWFPEWEFKGTPWTNSSGYEVWNPARFAANWQTPMLVVHGGKDYRVDLAHGLAAFTTLQRKGIPSKFLYYPEENHWVTRPANSVAWYKNVLGWLDTYTKSKAAVVPPFAP